MVAESGTKVVWQLFPEKSGRNFLAFNVEFFAKPVYLGFDLTLPFHLNPPNVIRRKVFTNSCYIHTLLHLDLNP